MTAKLVVSSANGVYCAWQGKDVMVGLRKAQSGHSGVGTSVSQLFCLGFLFGHWIST